jgi:hypothetical protein
LLYPQWLPGTHSPSNTVGNLAGLIITAKGTHVPWVRDRVNMWSFRVNVPQGASLLELRFQYLAPVKPQQGRISNKIADLTWNSVLLYPAGYFARRIQFSPEVKLPDGWRFATALDVKSQNGEVVSFKDVPLNTLVDSPLYAGINYKRVDLSTGPDNPVYLDVSSNTLNAGGATAIAVVVPKSDPTNWLAYAGDDVDARICYYITGDCTISRYAPLRGQAFFELDAKLAKNIKLGEKARLQIVAQAFNLTNRANYGNDFGENIASSTFGHPVGFIAPAASFIPRSLWSEFGVHFTF